MTALAVLARVLPESQVDDAVQLLSDDELQTFELYAGQLERLTQATLTRPLADITEAHELAAMVERWAVARKALEELRDARVRPLNDEVRAVNRLIATVRDQGDAFRKKAEGLLFAWKRQEAARLQAAREEKERKEREAQDREIAARQAAEAAATPEERRRHESAADVAISDQIQAGLDAGPVEVPRALKTAGGGSTGLREVYDLIAIHDLAKVPDQYKQNPKVVEALTAVLKAAVRGGVREIPGCEIGLVDRLTVRT